MRLEGFNLLMRYGYWDGGRLTGFNPDRSRMMQMKEIKFPTERKGRHDYQAMIYAEAVVRSHLKSRLSTVTV
ncbi:MAG TPA: hypothetical protein VN653_10965 [Anaerolineales bacterium]|nr:hypothetical protein [Anaerolineales bacterium]